MFLVAECPTGYHQVGTLSSNNDIKGGASGQHMMDNIGACKATCDSRADCAAFMFGNEYAGKKLKCELANYGTPNHSWGSNWRFCKKDVGII